jgi:hypothetical protein
MNGGQEQKGKEEMGSHRSGSRDDEQFIASVSFKKGVDNFHPFS